MEVECPNCNALHKLWKIPTIVWCDNCEVKYRVEEVGTYELQLTIIEEED